MKPLSRILKTAAVTVLLLLLCACAAGGNGKGDPAPSPSDKSVFERSSKRYSETELSEIVESSKSLTELNERYPVVCLRDSNGYFRVTYPGKNQVAVLLFDADGNPVLAGIHTTSVKKSDFESLTVGNTLANVRLMDPDGDFSFLYTGRTDIPRTSTHYTQDGWLVTVTYDDSDHIVEITSELL